MASATVTYLNTATESSAAISYEPVQPTLILGSEATTTDLESNNVYARMQAMVYIVGLVSWSVALMSDTATQIR